MAASRRLPLGHCGPARLRLRQRWLEPSKKKAWDLNSPLARTVWRGLGDVRAAHLDQPRLTTPETRDLDMIITALPEPWRVAVTGFLPDPPPLWREVSAPGTALVIIEGPDNDMHLPVVASDPSLQYSCTYHDGR